MLNALYFTNAKQSNLHIGCVLCSTSELDFTMHKQFMALGGRPGLVVMGGGSCSKGCEFESRHHIQDGHFFTYLFVVNFVMCV